MEKEDDVKRKAPVQEAKELFRSLSWTDRLLPFLVLAFMIAGTAAGATTGDAIPNAFNTVKLRGVSLPIALGLLIMMWPILTKVRYEKGIRFPEIFKGKRVWIHLLFSFLLNWIIGPFLMLALAWATLPDQPEYRIGVILVGIARCIAMVMIWNTLAQGDADTCAIIVIFNAALQIVLFAPLAVFFINVISGEKAFRLEYDSVAISVVIYLGIPLVAGVATRFGIWCLLSKTFLEQKFLPYFGQLALLGLLYTIFVLFAYQGTRIVHNLGPVFRAAVPLLLYFAIMWTSAFLLCYYLARRRQTLFNYETTAVQAFTAASNNFELAIAIAIAQYGVDSEQALASTIGPLVEVPVLLSLAYVSLWLRGRLRWNSIQPVETIGTVDNTKANSV